MAVEVPLIYEPMHQVLKKEEAVVSAQGAGSFHGVCHVEGPCLYSRLEGTKQTLALEIKYTSKCHDLIMTDS